MRILIIPALAIVLGGCTSEEMQKAFPRTTAGYEAGGVLGAIDGATGAILALCRKLDGPEFVVKVDNAAEVFGVVDTLDKVREVRRKICEGVGAIAVFSEGAGDAPEPAVTL